MQLEVHRRIHTGELCHSDPRLRVHTDEESHVPKECNMMCSASSGNCVLDGEVGDGDVETHANNSFDPSGSGIGNEESSTKKEDTDSFKVFGCGICCQSFSTKEETIHCFNRHSV